MTHPLTESPTSAIPRLVRNLLAADTTGLATFFDEISVADLPQFELPLSAPSLRIYPGNPKRERAVGGPINLVYDVSINVILPRPTPGRSSRTIPAKPVISSASSGSGVTGVWEYRLTEFGEDGESNASDETSVTLTSQLPTIALPALTTGGQGFRIWRSRKGCTACRWAGISWQGSVNWTDPVVDADLGAELAPVLLQGERLVDAITAVLLSGEYLLESGSVHADIVLAVDTPPATVVQGRNLWRQEIRATLGSYYDPITGQFLTEVP